MHKLLFVAFLMTVTALSTAFAQDFTAEQRSACRGDYNKFCKGTRPGGGRVLACLNQQRAALSDACRKVVDAQKK